jgi:predicted N-acetyltransferase YhbS
MNIRLEQPADYNAILRLTYEAFLTLDFPGRRRMDEHYLIHLLRNSPLVIRELCFVAELGGEIAGHILYTHSTVVQPDGSELKTLTFGPLSILPKYQRQGIGTALVRNSFDKAAELGHKAVLITGVPDYYPKFGFKRGREYGITLQDGTSPDALMAYEFEPGYLKAGALRFEANDIFEQAENDDEGFYAWHKIFQAK